MKGIVMKMATTLMILMITTMGIAAVGGEVKMAKSLSLMARCKENDKCVFQGKELFIEVGIKNESKQVIGYPLSFSQKTGPSIHLIDSHTKKDFFLPTNPADLALREVFTPIQPGQTVFLEWVIHASEIEQFGKSKIDLSAEIGLSAKIQIQGKLEDFVGKTSLRIIGNPSF